ncbi:hypothetical protein J4421_01375 [Candidatus Woesearchaeota archaeon]|nr:hypothetical protein [Candidatus Woesearchaeota archaeon]
MLMEESVQQKPAAEKEEIEDWTFEGVNLEEKKVTTRETRNILIILAVIVGIFLLTFGGASLYNKVTGGTVIDLEGLHSKNLEGELDEKEGYLYGEFSFVKADGLWWTEIMKNENTLLRIPLHFGPKELEEIKIEGLLSQKFNQGEDVFVAIDPNVADKYYSLAISELSFNMVKGMNRFPIGSCTTEDTICENRTIINCDTSQGRPTVQLASEGNQPRVQFSGTCIKLSGQGPDIVKAVDRLLYLWYRIMIE